MTQGSLLYLHGKASGAESLPYYADSEQRFIVANKFDELPRSEISDREWPQFVESMKKEIGLDEAPF